VLAAQQQQEQRHLRHQQQQQQHQHLHLPESRFSTWNSSPSQQHGDAAAAAGGPHASLHTHASAGMDAGVCGSSSLSGGSIRGHSSGSGSSSSILHTWGGSSSSPGSSSSSRQRAAAVPRLSAQGVLAAAAAAAGGGGGPTSPGGLLTPMILLRFPSCRLEGAVVKMVGADHRRNQSPCEDVVAWRTPLGDRQQVRDGEGMLCTLRCATSYQTDGRVEAAFAVVR
jgi:hypothetical protein